MIPERNGKPKRDAGGVLTLDKLPKRKVGWLWPGRVPRAMLTILEGRKGTGKSTLAAALVADVTGGPRIERGKKRELGNVLWLSVEEDYASTIQARLHAAGVKLSRIVFPHAEGRREELRRFSFPTDANWLETFIQEHKIVFVVLDPWTSFVDPQLSMNDEQGVRCVLEPLKSVAARTGCTFLLIRHLRKSGYGPALDQGMGSAAIGNVARSILRVDQHGRMKDCRYLAHVACNNAPTAPTLVFRVETFQDAARIKWEGESSIDAERLAEGQGDAGERGERADARTFLRRELEGGEKRVKDLEKKAEESGIRPRTLRRAKEELGVTSHPVGRNEERYFVWRKPVEWPDDEQSA